MYSGNVSSRPVTSTKSAPKPAPRAPRGQKASNKIREDSHETSVLDGGDYSSVSMTDSDGSEYAEYNMQYSTQPPHRHSTQPAHLVVGWQFIICGQNLSKTRLVLLCLALLALVIFV